jgi:vancomycin resistance protein YoaR
MLFRSKQFLISLAILVGLAASIYRVVYLNKVYPHVFIASQEVSNLKLSQVETILNHRLAELPSQLTLKFDSQEWLLSLDQWQINYQPTTTAQRAYLLGRDGSPITNLKTLWQSWWQPVQLPLTFSLNESLLNDTINEINSSVAEPPIAPALALQADKSVKVVAGKNGRVVDTEALRQEILDRLGRLDFSNIELPIQLVSTDTNNDQLVSAQERAEIIKGKKLILKYEDQTTEFSGQTLINLIGFTSDWNEVEIASQTAQLAANFNRPPQDATFQFDGARVIEFKPALKGLTLDETITQTLILEKLNLLASDPAATQTIELVMTTTEPKITTEAVNNLGIKELLGKGESTFHGSIASRKHNVALTAQKINGIIVPPGEVFSFNQVVGDISRATGYQEAYIIQGGRTVLGDGGGVCQDSTTLFRAVLNSGLEIVERRAHAYRVGYYEQNAPVGLDATVYSPSPDFKFKNDTPAHILIQTQVDLSRNYLKFEIYGTSDGRKATLSNFRLWGQTPPPPDLYVDDPTLPVGQTKQIDWKAWGAKAAFDWQVVRSGETIHQKTFYSTYQPWQAVFLRGTAI